MDTVKSFKGYGKVDELEQAAFKRKTRKRFIILFISTILLLALFVGILAGTLAHRSDSSGEALSSPPAMAAAAVKSLCSKTLYPETCYSTLASSNTTDLQKIFRFSLTAAMKSLKEVVTLPDDFMGRTENPMVREALDVCRTTLSDAVETLNDTVGTHDVDELKTWLSTAITDQETCSDALVETNATFAGEFRVLLRNSSELASNSLAIVSYFFDHFKNGRRRRLLAAKEPHFPRWVKEADRRLLLQSRPRPDLTVAADGSGDVETIGEAVAKIPNNSEERFVVYVKRGVYVENVELDRSKTNVMIYGDGRDATVISGSKNFVDNNYTFYTATFGVRGKGFIARDIGFRNTAGPAKHQAVAFRSSSDRSVCYNCSFDAFQDTLYVHSNRQFYRDCLITGTVDFIFGNAAAVFQNCSIKPRQPMPKQYNTVTAQGKTDPNQNTGISIQRCTIDPFGNLTAETYLGRPWKDYSTTVVMQSYIGGLLNPLGWAPWNATMDPPPRTIYYGEYRNSGPGSSTRGRVNWAGLEPEMTVKRASEFFVESFIQGPSWLTDANVVFDST